MSVVEQERLQLPKPVVRYEGAFPRVSLADADLYVFAGLIVLTAAFGRGFAKVGVAQLHVTEAALVAIALLTLRRHGIREAWQLLRERLPLFGLGVFWLAGAVASVRGMAGYGFSQTLNDIGLAEYSLLVPLVALVIDSRERLHLLVKALALGSAIAAALSIISYGLVVPWQVSGFPSPTGATAAGLYMSIFPIWVFSRFAHGDRIGRFEWCVAALAGLGLGLTDQRSAWLALAAGLAVAAVLAPRGRRALSIAASALAVVGVLGATLAVETAVSHAGGTNPTSLWEQPERPAQGKPTAASEPSASGGVAVPGDTVHGTPSREVAARQEVQLPLLTGLEPGTKYAISFYVKPLTTYSAAEGQAGDTSGAGWSTGSWRARPGHWTRAEVKLTATAPTERFAMVSYSGADRVRFAQGAVHLANRATRRHRAGARPAAPPASKPRRPRATPGTPPKREPQIEREFSGALSGAGSPEGDNASWRLDFWKFALKATEATPLMGHGFGRPMRFVWDGKRYDFRDGNPSNHIDVAGPHNEFVHITYRMGALGIGALLALIAIAAYGTLRLLRSGALGTSDRVATVALAGVFTSATVLAAMNDALKGPFMAIFFWTALAALLIAPRLLGDSPRER
jgi:O-antigen ligase